MKFVPYTKMMSEHIEILNEIRSLFEHNKEKINLLNQRVNELKEILLQTHEDTQKMSTHIDFVEAVYERIKAPMHYIVDKFNKMHSIGAVAISRLSFLGKT